MSRQCRSGGHSHSADGTVEVEWDADTVWLCGEIDAHNVAWLRETLDAALDGGVSRLDLSQLRFCSAAGLRTLLGVRSPASPAGGVPVRPSLCNATPAMAHLLALVADLDSVS